MKYSKSLFKTVVFFSVCALVACAAEDKTEKKSYSYELEENGCNTGKKTFKDKKSYCESLLNDAANNGCAPNLRALEYQNNKCDAVITSQPMQKTTQDKDGNIITQEGRTQTFDGALSYQYIQDGCDTGPQKFQDAASYCEALKNNELNKNCAEGLRLKTYEKNCTQGDPEVDARLLKIKEQEKSSVHFYAEPDTELSFSQKTAQDASLISLEGHLSMIQQGDAPKLQAPLNLSAAEKISFVQMQWGECELSVKQFKVNEGNKSMDLVLMGSDSKTVKSEGCFMKLSELKSKSFAVKFENVPTGEENSAEKISMVTVVISPRKR